MVKSCISLLTSYLICIFSSNKSLVLMSFSVSLFWKFSNCKNYKAFYKTTILHFMFGGRGRGGREENKCIWKPEVMRWIKILLFIIYFMNIWVLDSQIFKKYFSKQNKAFPNLKCSLASKGVRWRNSSLCEVTEHVYLNVVQFGHVHPFFIFSFHLENAIQKHLLQWKVSGCRAQQRAGNNVFCPYKFNDSQSVAHNSVQFNSSCNKFCCYKSIYLKSSELIPCKDVTF